MDGVDKYLKQGCGRCPLGATPDCKVHNWSEELKYLRRLVLGCGLTEEVKWSVPCYTIDGKNVLIVSAFRDYCAISFFKGSLIKDEKNLLHKPGKNSQASRLFKFTSLDEVKEIETDVKSYIQQAIHNEKAGLKVEFKKHPEPIPEELEDKFNEDPVFKSAFDGLTPGRQRGYILFFSAPKKSETRISRIEKYTGKILNGEGMHDEYRRSMKRK